MAEAGRLLGITPRQSQYYATGYTDVPTNIEKLLLAYIEVRMLRSALVDAWGMINRNEGAAALLKVQNSALEIGHQFSMRRGEDPSDIPVTPEQEFRGARSSE